MFCIVYSLCEVFGAGEASVELDSQIYDVFNQIPGFLFLLLPSHGVSSLSVEVPLTMKPKVE